MPNQITHRVDGWVIDPEDENRIPAAVAEMIARAITQPSNSVVANILKRLIERQRKALGNV